MKLGTAISLLLGLLALGLPSNAAAQSFADGEAAYHDGRYAEAWAILRPLAEAGDTRAEDRMGLMCLFGEGAPKSLPLAVRWFRKAADQGDGQAEYRLGDIYTGIDQTQAIFWLRKAAEQGVSLAEITLGGDYENGFGVPQDNAQAAQWYRKAADQGNINAQLSLGMMYGDGRGVPKDPVTAYVWLSLAHRTDPHDILVSGERDRVAAKMSGAQLAAARRRERGWVPVAGDN
jgi:TPR repeat protein